MSVVLANEGCEQVSLRIVGKILVSRDGEYLVLLLLSFGR